MLYLMLTREINSFFLSLNLCANKICITGICTRNPGNFVSGMHLRFVTSLNTCLWNPATYKHKTVRLSSAQLGLVMKVFLFFKSFFDGVCNQTIVTNNCKMR